MGSPPTTGEIHKLAHTLGVTPTRLDALRALPPEDLRALRGQIAEALFQADRSRFATVAALSKAVPVAVAAKLTEHAFPPLLAARTAELVDPQRAGELVARLSDDYLADVSAALDPGRAREVIAAIPAHRIARVGAELARRQEWVVIGGFIDQVSPGALAATVREFDGEQLLRIGFVLDDKRRLDDITGLVTELQLDAMLEAARSQKLWAELDELLSNLSPPRVARLARRYAAAPARLRSALAKAAATGVLSERSLTSVAGAH
ncbi:MAG: hypothetical protein M3N95_01690 [Actinomycetota bacterium]|nr:hypothetical protein [Actinomycetota bacterium]